MTDMKVDLKYLSEERSRHGKPRLYVRLNGKRIRILARPGTPAFLDEYRRAVAQLREVTGEGATTETRAPALGRHLPETLGWLIHQYLTASIDFRQIKPTGQRRRRAILEDLARAHGTKPMRIPTTLISAGLTARADKPGAANNWLKSIKALYSWAAKAGVVKSNPADAVRKIKTRSSGYYTWSMDDIRRFAARYPIGSMEYTALMLLLLTGLRRDDAVKLGRQHVRDGKIRFQTSKTGAVLSLHMPTPLADALAAGPVQSTLAYLTTSRGEAFRTGNSFGNWLKDRCRLAGVPDGSAHGLRKAGATIAAEMGASDQELDALYGWSEHEMRGTYTAAARDLLLATNACARIISALVEAEILPGTYVQTGNTIVAP